ncbi:MAG TPA: MoaD/ThiS family protein [Aeromicrobium sp.]|nr:MoaD/ThiS family protein [Aeromicrobium sp.]
MRLRYFAAAAEMTGRHEQDVDGPITMGQLRAWLESEYGPVFAQVLRRSSLLVDGHRPGDDDALPDGATVDVLPPFAGG